MAASFFTSHIDAVLSAGSANFAALISASAVEYGLTQPLADAYASVNAIWQDAYLAAVNPGTRTKSLVLAKNSARAELRKMASNLAQLIGSTPAVTDSQKIDLGLNVRAKSSPIAAPGRPYQFTTALDETGSVTLQWKCDHPRGAVGTMYCVYRSVGGMGAPVQVGMVGKKKFVDTTIPAGATSLEYRVQAYRSTVAGAVAAHNVNFGNGGSVMSIEAMTLKAA